ncbi:MAG TPA: PASTA domain-containing protein, partial [Allosphingosinicella sp.]|nr:PASTA domain-containing protein [Allosphingosinicella sp.]
MAIEVERIAAGYGEDHPEVAERRMALEAARGRFRLFDAELARARVKPGTPAEGQAGISGLVLRGGAAIPAATVIAYAQGKRVGFACTREGGFFIEVPPDLAIILSVVLPDGGEGFRDREGVPLSKGQAIFRTIDLDRLPHTCPEPAEPATAPVDDSFPMVRLIGQREAQAAQLIAAQGLKLGARHEKVEPAKAGTVIGQTPSAGAKVRPGLAVEIRIAIDDLVAVPPLIGSAIDDARLALAKGHLVLG